MSEKYLNTLDKQARKLEQRFLTDDSAWDQDLRDLAPSLENTAELDKINQSVKENAQDLVNRLKTHKWELEEVDNEVVHGTAIDQFCGDVNLIMSLAVPEYIDVVNSIDRARTINESLKKTIDPLRHCVKRAFEFAVNVDSAHSYDWEQMLEKISADAVKQFGAVLPLALSLDYVGDGEAYMFGYSIPVEEDFEINPSTDPLAHYWSQLFKPAYEELECEYEAWVRQRESGEDIDIAARIAERWPELHNKYITPGEQTVVAQTEKFHNNEREVWMQALHTNKDAYGFDDADMKKAESVINKAFDSSIEESLTGLFDDNHTRAVAEMSLRG